MPTSQVPTQTLIDRKMSEILGVQREHSTHKIEAERGSYMALGERRRLHMEWDELYDAWCLLVLRRMVEQMDEPQAAS